MTLTNTLLRYAAMSILFIGLTACGDQEETQAATADIEVSISTNPHWEHWSLTCKPSPTTP